MRDNVYFPLRKCRAGKGQSEQALARAAGVSRRLVRDLISSGGNPTLRSLEAVANAVDRKIEVLARPNSTSSDFSTVAAAYKTEQDGFESWKIHYMELADEFRRSLDPALILLPPHSGFDKRLTALLASLVHHLCREAEMPPPAWAVKRYYLDTPWFVAGVESLKASAILESPLPFRNNNIFVHENFAARV